MDELDVHPLVLNESYYSKYLLYKLTIILLNKRIKGELFYRCRNKEQLACHSGNVVMFASGNQ